MAEEGLKKTRNELIQKKAYSLISSAFWERLVKWRRAEDFIKAYEKLNDASYPISSLYVSHIISYLIGYSR